MQRSTFNAAVDFTGYDDNGTQKKLQKIWLFEAESYTEAETKAYEKGEEEGLDNFYIARLNKRNFADLILDETEESYFHEVKMRITLLDETKGKETESKLVFLVESRTIDTAIAKTREFHKDTIVPFEIIEAKESKIQEVILHQVAESETESEESEK